MGKYVCERAWCVCMHACLSVYVYLCAHVCAHLSVYVHACTRVWVCVCVYLALHFFPIKRKPFLKVTPLRSWPTHAGAMGKHKMTTTQNL